MKTKRVFISDIHLSSEELYEAGRSWYQPKKHRPRLLGFLERHVLAHREEIKDLVLLGDIFNNWVCPAGKAPPSYPVIFKANPDELKALRKAVKAGINVFFLSGNHDFDLEKRVIEAKVKGLRAIKVYRSGRIHAEHGNSFDIYNRPDFICDPAYGRPIGYFLSRLATSAGTDDFGILDLPAYLDYILEAAVTPQTIFESMIEGMAERAGMGDGSKIRMPGGRTMTVAAVKERYSRLAGIYNVRELISDLYQRRYLHGPADRLCARDQVNVVVFGHTHNALIDKDWFLVEDRIYANTGSMCKDNAYAVEINKSREPDVPLTVSLLKIAGDGTAETQEEEEVAR